MANKLSDEMKKTLAKNGYQDFGDFYRKERLDGKIVTAVVNGSGVILHLGDEDGNNLTQTKQPAIHPTMQVDNPEELSAAEDELCS